MTTTQHTSIPTDLLNEIYQYFVITGYHNDSKMHYLCEQERQMSIALLPFIDESVRDQHVHEEA